LVLGCGPKPEEDDFIRPRKKAGGESGSKLKPVGGEYEGTIKGKVVWKGKVDLEEETRKLQDQIKGKQDADHCSAGNSVQHAFRIGDNGNLGNVFVWIEPEAGHYFQVPEAQVKEFQEGGKLHRADLGQPNCNFTPHCVVLFPSYLTDGEKVAPTGQQLRV